MKISKEFKVGLLTVISFSVLYFGFNYLKGINAFSSNHYYFAVYNTVDGLQVSNPVMINGLTVGRVNDISIMQGVNNKILVEIEVDEEINVGAQTEAHLVDNGLLGGKMISLQLKNGGSVEDGDTLISKKPSGMLELLQQNATPLMDKAGNVMDSVSDKIGELQMSDVQSILKNSAVTVQLINSMLANNKSKLDSIMTNFQQVSAALVKMEKKMNPILDKMNTVADSMTKVEMAATVAELQATLAEAKKSMKSINEGEGTVGKLMTDKAIYDNMNATIKDLDSLFIDMKAHPGRYVQFSVFGKKDKEAKRKEKEAKRNKKK
ncbi:MAG: MlaD family protein [Flammeovirgaceae bacterium]